MVNITILELNLPESTFSASLPFGDQAEDEQDSPPADEDSGGRRRLAIVATFVVLVLAAALAKYLTGGEDHDVEIETPDEPVGVTVDEE